MFYFRLASTLALFCQAGLMFVTLFWAQGLSWVEKMCLAFGLGVGLISSEMLIISLLGIPLAFWSVSVPWGVAWSTYLLVVAVRHWRRLKDLTGLWGNRRSAIRLHLGWADSVLLVVLGAVALTVVLRGTFHPVLEWDGWAIWDLKARAFYYHRSIFPFVNDTYYALAHLDYPLLYPLAGTFVYLGLGQITDGVATLPAAFYVATLGIVYAALRRYGSRRTLALALALGLACVPSILFWSQQYYAEIPLLYYVVASGLFLFFHLRQPQLNWLLLSAALAGFATQTKVEGILLVAVSGGAVALRASLASSPESRRRLWAATGWYALIIAALFLPWFVFRRFLAPLPQALSYWSDWSRVLASLAFLPTVIAAISNWMVDPRYQSMFFLVFPVTGLLVICNWKKYMRQLALAYLLAYCFMLLIPSTLLFLVEPVWLEPDRLGRYLVVFTGMCYLLLAFQTVDLFRPVSQPGAPQLSPGLATAQRVVVGLLFVALAIELAADAWPGQLPSAPFTSRPAALFRQVYAEAREMLPLNSAERQQLVNVRVARPDYGRLIQVALDATPQNEAVALWVRPDNTDDYLFQKSYYWLYPRKVRILRQAAELTPDRLSAAGIGTVIVYDQDENLSGAGYTIYQPTPRLAVVRVNAAGASASRTLGFVAAPVDLDQGLQLIGYQIIPPLLNNDTLILLSWRGTQPINRSYTAFVHVFSQDEFVTQNDSIPALGQLSTESWRPGEIVLDAHAVVLPRNQRVQTKICIGMYDSTTLQRLSIWKADGYDVSNNVACRPALQ